MAEIKNPVTEGLRKDYPELSDLSDDELMGGVKDVDFPDLSEKEYHGALQDVYGKIPEAPKQPGIVKQMATDVWKDIKATARVFPTIMEAAAVPSFKKAQLPEESYSTLRARGYSPKVARNIFKQRIATEQSLAEEQTKIGGKGAEEAGRAAGTLISLGAGGGAEIGLIRKLGVKALTRIVPQAAIGGTSSGTYMGIKAASEDKPASEILKEIETGALMGAIAQPVLAGATRGIYALIRRPAVGAQRNVEMELAKQLQARATGAVKFAEDFKPEWAGRYRNEYQFITDPSIASEDVARTLLKNVLGWTDDEPIPDDAIKTLAEKVAKARDLSFRDPSLVNIPEGQRNLIERPGGVVPPAREIRPPGGEVPEPNVPFEAPVAEERPVFAPPEGVVPEVEPTGPAPRLPEEPLRPEITPKLTPQEEELVAGLVRGPQEPYEPVIYPRTVEPIEGLQKFERFKPEEKPTVSEIKKSITKTKAPEASESLKKTRVLEQLQFIFGKRKYPVQEAKISSGKKELQKDLKDYWTEVFVNVNKIPVKNPRVLEITKTVFSSTLFPKTGGKYIPRRSLFLGRLDDLFPELAMSKKGRTISPEIIILEDRYFDPATRSAGEYRIHSNSIALRPNQLREDAHNLGLSKEQTFALVLAHEAAHAHRVAIGRSMPHKLPYWKRPQEISARKTATGGLMNALLTLKDPITLMGIAPLVVPSIFKKREKK